MGIKLLKIEFSEPINQIRGLEEYEKIRLLADFVGHSRYYLAYSITRVSRITETLISPGYCISFSI